MTKLFFYSLMFLAIVLNCSEKKNLVKISVNDYKDKVYASWLGQIIGNIYGLPHENRHIEKPGPETFPYGYGPNIKWLKENNGAFSDDDTDIEYMYLLAMEKYGPEPTYAQLTESWKYHVRERVWLANRAALAAMHYGYSPPVTGMKEYNPHWFQIDPQLVNEIWAVTAPGMVQYAAKKSGWSARITDDDWGIEPTILYGAMYSAAFFESDIHKLIDIGLKALPENSRFARTVEKMKELHQKYPDNWKQARQAMADMFYNKEPLDTKTIWNANLNGACAILALLYGGGDFQKTLDLACAMGFDADNQAATMAGLLGAVLGTKGLPKELLYPVGGWNQPFNDLYKNVSRYDMPDASLNDMAERMARQGEKIILKHGGKKITENGEEFYLINPEAEFVAPLEFPGAPRPYIEVGKKMEYEFYVSG
ncbi:MAG: ADP-ribosylglycohydrolase family protein, partial [bacterium]